MRKTAPLFALLSASYGSAQATTALAPASSGGAGGGSCVQAPGDFNMSAYQLYPENLDFDGQRCLLYSSCLYNASIVVYDVRRKAVVQVMEIEKPRITGNATIHASGVQLDAARDRLTFMLNAGAAFDTNGEDIAGPNYLVSFDLQRNATRFVVDLSLSAKPGLRAFQDMEHDRDGNIFVVGSYGASMLRVSGDDGTVTEWWASAQPAPVKGLTGAAKYNDSVLLVTDQGDGQLYRYSMAEARTRTKTALGGAANLSAALDGIYLPPKHGGAVLLASDSDAGTHVLQTCDGWASAELLGTVPNPFLDAQPFRGFTAASVQIVDRIYAATEWFVDNGGTKPGNRTDFPMLDITDRVQAMVKPCDGRRAGSAVVRTSGASSPMMSVLGLGLGLAAAVGLVF